MKKIKILLMGITGDLAKRKVIPAIAQFAERNNNKFTTELIGFSRSKAEDNEIIDLLNGNSKDAQHKLSQISYVEAQYDNATILDNIFSQLHKDERLIIYLAVPPSTFIPFLQKACPLHHHNIDIVVEKPFGQNLEEAENIIAQIKDCVLTRRIHFFDHYAFKISSKINSEVLSNIDPYIDGKIKKIEIQALEKVDTQGRAGYFERTGALKDMFQHIITMYLMVCNYFNIPSIDIANIYIDSIITGQYDDYRSHSGNNQSTTETYFKLIMTMKNELQISAESGKSLGKKSTSVSLLFDNGTTVLWNLEPQKHITVIKKNTEMISFGFIDDHLLDHTRLFESIILDDFSRMIKQDQILRTWKMYNLVFDYMLSNNVTPTTYKTGFYPIEFIKFA
jgi:glucose-6-phosphate 1-dehydrogenase